VHTYVPQNIKVFLEKNSPFCFLWLSGHAGQNTAKESDCVSQNTSGRISTRRQNVPKIGSFLLSETTVRTSAGNNSSTKVYKYAYLHSVCGRISETTDNIEDLISPRAHPGGGGTGSTRCVFCTLTQLGSREVK
jgi:hypothetical protein